MDFVSLIVAVHRSLASSSLPHAFGGALALGYVAEPRGTVDIDVNVFVGADEVDRIAAALQPLDYRRTSPATSAPIDGVRFEHATHPFPVDAFPSLHEAYDEIARRIEWHPFGRASDVLPFLSAEDLSLFKLSFNRPQDWVDLQSIATARPGLDVEYIERQLVALRGHTMHPRVERLRRLLGNQPS